MLVNEALRESRSRSGRSQEYMALELGVARKTIQNWEKGSSEPTIGQAISWFKALGLSPLPYLFRVVYNDFSDPKLSDSDVDINDRLMQLVETLPEEGALQLMYLFYGDHGGSPRAILNMLTAHLQTPMKDRVTNSTIIMKNYDLAKRRGELSSPDMIQPDIKLLARAIELGEEAAVNDETAYVMGGPSAVAVTTDKNQGDK